MATSQAGICLLALRALTHRPSTALAAVHPDPAAAWRDGDPDVTARLADVALRALGLCTPSTWVGHDVRDAS